MKHTNLFITVYLCLAGVLLMAPLAAVTMSGRLETPWALPLALAGALAVETGSVWRREALVLMFLGLAIPAAQFLMPIPFLQFGSDRAYVSPAVLLLAIAAVTTAVTRTDTISKPKSRSGWGFWMAGCSFVLGLIALTGYAALSRHYNLEPGILRGVLLNACLLCGAWVVSGCLPDPACWGRPQRLLAPLALCGLSALQWFWGVQA